eukprot:916184-Pyramimonas_sp.AAC.1
MAQVWTPSNRSFPGLGGLPYLFIPMGSEAGSMGLYTARSHMRFRWLGPEPMEVATECAMVISMWNGGPQRDLQKIASSEIWVDISRSGEVIGRENI